jgi:anaerobic magnesium-protoporphyrin IX monomethyl ester cyclase
MKVCLIHPPQPNSLDDRLDVPLGLLYIAATLRNDGNDVRVIDLSSHPENQWETLIGTADVYGITVYTCAYNIAKKIRDICKEINSECTVVVGGPHPTALPIETKKDFDVVIVGEGEYEIGHVIRWNINQAIIFSKSLPILDDIPMPARDLIDLSSYHRKVGEELATSVITSRGCPFDCSFCGSKEMFGKVRLHSIERVVTELKSLVDIGYKNIIFYDDVFTLFRKRLYPLLDEIKKLNITFRCNGRAGVNTLEDFHRLKEAGCHTIAFGIETGSQKLLNKINKKVTVQQNIDTIQNAKKAGIITKAYMIIGLPGENKETIEETKKFLDEADPDIYTLFTFVPLPGCDIWAHPDKYGVKIISQNWDDYYVIAGQNDGGITISTDTYTPDELIEMKTDLLKYLKSRPWRGTIENYEKLVEWRTQK